MNIEMYRIFFDIQKKHWWFVSKQNIIIDIIKRYCHLHKEHSVLDIGCGSGLMLNALDSFATVSGMDVSDDAIQFSREIFNGPIKKGELPYDIPFKGASYDLITALDVIEHIEDDVGSLKAIRGLLKPAGVAIITVPAFMFLWSNFDERNEHKRRYSIFELREKLVKAGFSIEKISYFNTFLFPIIFLTRKIKKYTNDDGYSDINMPIFPINYALKKIFSIEKFILRRFNFQFGVSIVAVVRR